MKSFFDANVLLEVLLPARPRVDSATRAIRQGRQSTISSLTVHLYMDFGLRYGLAIAQLAEDVSRYAIASLGSDEVAWAVRNCQGDDFEDALQVACALFSGCTEFITLDKQLAKNYGQFMPMKLL